MKRLEESEIILAKEERKLFLIRLKNECLLLFRDVVNAKKRGKKDAKKESMFIASVLSLFKALKQEMRETTFGKIIEVRNDVTKKTEEMNEYAYAVMFGEFLEEKIISDDLENIHKRVSFYNACKLLDFMLKYMKDAKIEE